jgi:hypothetical protein
VSKRIWFGNRRFMQWCEPYAASPEYGRRRLQVTTEFDNGGYGIEQTLDGSMHFTLSWNARSVDDLAFVFDYASGLYGTEPLYWSDPMYAHRNALSPALSMPWLAAQDAMPLIRRTRPVAVPNPDTSQGYPPFSARYTVLPTDEPLSFPVPIPPGHTAWVGIHSEDPLAVDMVKVTRYEGLVEGAISHPTLLGVGTSQRVNTAFASSGGQSWIELSLDLSGLGPSEQRTFDLTGLAVQVIPTGQAPSTGRFLVGRGHSGCRFDGFPTEQPYSSALDRTVYAAKLVETGAWE